jgi:hypothetical protein
MKTTLLSLAAVALFATAEAQAQQTTTPQPPTTQQPMGQGMMCSGSTMGPGMMGMHGAMMLPMIIAMMDVDGDGALSLDEFQAVHARIFKVIDANNDGKVMVDELRNAFHAAPATPPAQ